MLPEEPGPFPSNGACAALLPTKARYSAGGLLQSEPGVLRVRILELWRREERGEPSRRGEGGVAGCREA